MGRSGLRISNPMRLVGCNTIMHFVVLATVIQLGSMRNYDPTNDLGEDDFRSQFGLDPITDPKLKAKRFKALKQHEEIIKKQNLQYDNGVKPWFDKLNEFSDLTDEEFVKAKTGLNPSPSDGYGRGLILHGPELAKTNCKDYGNKCRKSCGLCKGMTPHPSNTCPDYWPSCKTYWKNYCDHKEYKEKCCMSCKGVKIPCKDVWGDSCVSRRDEFCANAGWATMCKKTCGLCQ